MAFLLTLIDTDSRPFLRPGPPLSRLKSDLVYRSYHEPLFYSLLNTQYQMLVNIWVSKSSYFVFVPKMGRMNVA